MVVFVREILYFRETYVGWNMIFWDAYYIYIYIYSRYFLENLCWKLGNGFESHWWGSYWKKSYPTVTVPESWTDLKETSHDSDFWCLIRFLSRTNYEGISKHTRTQTHLEQRTCLLAYICLIFAHLALLPTLLVTFFHISWCLFIAEVQIHQWQHFSCKTLNRFVLLRIDVMSTIWFIFIYIHIIVYRYRWIVARKGDSSVGQFATCLFKN